MENMINKVNNPKTNIPKLLLKISTEELSTVLKTISGFINNLNEHQTKCGEAYDESCDHCKTCDKTGKEFSTGAETANHILNKCPSFTKLRQEIFGEFYTTTESIFKNHTLSKANMKYLIKFMKKINTLNKSLKINKQDRSPSRAWPRKRKNKENEEQNKNTEKKKNRQQGII